MAMEKPSKSKNGLLKFLPRAASAVSFQNHPFSPSRQDKMKTHVGRGFSGPIISMIPAEARRKSKNSSFEAQEPTSPKVSCMGQIKLKHKHKNKTKIKKTKQTTVSPPIEAKKKPSTSTSIRNMFSGSAKAAARKSDAHKPPLIPDGTPSLNQMKRFASGRDKFASFDWTAQIAPAIDSDQRNYYSDEERGDSEGEEEVIIPFSAPILLGGIAALEPRKEVNLWKRRTMVQPRPLQLNTLVIAN
uniref:Syringolide-induced protein 14-1-1 n=1 Tax=Davidia involucrata TaxID=16924 RepID=A0A5B6YUQ5_DAVIN